MASIPLKARRVTAALLVALLSALGGASGPGIAQPQVMAAAAERPTGALDEAEAGRDKDQTLDPALPPDIIVFMVDDLVYLPDQRVLERLPNIRREFLDGGLRFTNMNATIALCGPSRVTFLTGQHPRHHRVVRITDTFRTPTDSIHHRFQEAGGYATLNQGKGIHVPVQGGADTGWSKRNIFVRQARKFEDQGVRWIEDTPRDQPLFAWYSTNFPHEIPGKYYPHVAARFQGDPRCADLEPFKPPTYKTWDEPRDPPFHMPMDVADGWDLTKTCESMLGIDEAIGAIVEAQQARDRPVVLVFTTDHGVALGQFGYPFKWSPYARRTEFYMAGTGIPTGVSTNALVSDIDVAPTLADAAGVELDYPVDGQSFWSLAQGDMDYPGRRYHLCHFEVPGYPSLGFRCVVSRKWFAIFWDDGRERLTKADGWGRRNLKDAEPEQLDWLRLKANQLYDEARA